MVSLGQIHDPSAPGQSKQAIDVSMGGSHVGYQVFLRDIVEQKMKMVVATMVHGKDALGS